VEEDGNLAMFVVMALNHFIHALAEAEDALSLPTEVGSARAVSVDKTLSHLLSFIQRTIPHRPIVLHCDPLHLSTRQSTPLAYLVTAAIGNAFRHGCGNIEVRLKIVGDEVCLDVSDDSASLPDTSQPHPQRYILWGESEMEVELIDSMVHRDLRGRIVETPETDRGRICVVFPLEQSVWH
jgi:two-component sensor histidine kinase